MTQRVARVRLLQPRLVARVCVMFQTPLKLAADSYQTLANYLVRPATNDIGRARSFFVWIASQRLQDIVEFVDNTLPPEDSPLYTVLLMLLKQWGNGYSELFSKLCQ